MGNEQQPPRKKYEHIWHAILGACRVACYDFQLYKRSLPPIDNPEVVYPEQFKRPAQGEEGYISER